jgi:hypothetical protein
MNKVVHYRGLSEVIYSTVPSIPVNAQYTSLSITNISIATKKASPYSMSAPDSHKNMVDNVFPAEPRSPMTCNSTSRGSAGANFHPVVFH